MSGGARDRRSFSLANRVSLVANEQAASDPGAAQARITQEGVAAGVRQGGCGSVEIPRLCSAASCSGGGASAMRLRELCAVPRCAALLGPNGVRTACGPLSSSKPTRKGHSGRRTPSGLARCGEPPKQKRWPGLIGRCPHGRQDWQCSALSAQARAHLGAVEGQPRVRLAIHVAPVAALDVPLPSTSGGCGGHSPR
jgi:hypothetical protein